MDLRAVLVGSISAVHGLSGCATGYCGPDERFDDLGRSFTQEEMDEVLDIAAFDENRGACEWACIHMLWADGMDLRKMSECELVLDEDYVPSEPNRTPAGTLTEKVGSVVCSGEMGEACVGGRRPMTHGRNPAQGAVDWLQELATLEHQSVAAFNELEQQLAEFGAPHALRTRCSRAARDEVRHTSLVCGLAGIDPSTLPAAPDARIHATPFEVAAHNAVEGCVNECWAALLAGWQSLHAGRAEVRDVFRRLAADEASHGQLAWDIHQWFLETLPAAQCEDLVRLQRDALAELRLFAGGQSTRWPVQLGFPVGSIATRLATTFAANVTERLAA